MDLTSIDAARLKRWGLRQKLAGGLMILWMGVLIGAGLAVRFDLGETWTPFHAMGMLVPQIVLFQIARVIAGKPPTQPADSDAAESAARSDRNDARARAWARMADHLTRHDLLAHGFWRAAVAAGVAFLGCGFVYVLCSTGIDLEELAVAAACAIAAPSLAIAVYVYLSKRHADLPWRRETRCRICGYILRGITEPRCPECGERI